MTVLYIFVCSYIVHDKLVEPKKEGLPVKVRDLMHHLTDQEFAHELYQNAPYVAGALLVSV